MQGSIDRFFSERVTEFTSALQALAARVAPESPADDSEVLAELTFHINAVLTSCAELELELGDNAELLKQTQVRFREAIWPWFGQSWCMTRAFTKPRGYPGDYELLTAIYNRVPKTLGFGGYLDSYFLNTTLGQAVPARMRSAREFLLSEIQNRDGKVTILNVACGACREYTEGFDAVADREIELTLIDNDPLAIEFVQEQIAPKFPANIAVTYARYNALRMTNSHVNVERFNRNQILYSVGLCDYIPDEYLIPMLKGWRESVADGGIVYVAFKDMHLYNKNEYQWLVDWYFYQRTDDECRDLFAKAGFDMDQLEVNRSETPVIINYIGRVTQPEFARPAVAERQTTRVK